MRDPAWVAMGKPATALDGEPAPSEPPPAALPYARFGPRFGGFLADKLLVFIFRYFAGPLALAPFVGFHWIYRDYVLSKVTFVASVLGFGGMLALAGQTPGMMAFGIFVHDRQSERISFIRGIARVLAEFFLSLAPLGLGYLPILFTKDRRAVHDFVVGTWVSQRPTTRMRRAFAVAMAAAGVAGYALTAIPMVHNVRAVFAKPEAFSAPDGRFTVRIPGTPTMTRSRRGVAYEFRTDRTTYYVGVEGLARSDFSIDPSELLSMAADRAAHEWTSSIVATRPVSSGAYPGLEFDATQPGPWTLAGRVFLVDDRLYVLIADAEGQAPPKFTDEFFDSFTLTGLDSATAHNDRGTTLVNIGKQEEGLREYYEANRLDPKLDLALLNIAITEHRLGRPAKALPFAREYANTRPDDPTAHVVLAAVLQSVSESEKDPRRDLQAAAVEWKYVCELDSTETTAFSPATQGTACLNLADIDATLDDRSSADAALARAEQLMPHSSALSITKARVLRSEHRVAEAIALLRGSAGNDEIARALADALYSDCQLREAEKILTTLPKTGKSGERDSANLATIAAQKGSPCEKGRRLRGDAPWKLLPE